MTVAAGRGFDRAVGWGQGLYLGGLAVVACVAWWFTDSWWPTTVMAFAPRWPYLLPMPALLAVHALRMRKTGARRALARAGALAFGLGLWLFAVADLQVMPTAGAAAADAPAFTLMTYNTGGIRDQRLLRELVRRHDADAVVLQECSLSFDPALWTGLFTHQKDTQCFVARAAPIEIDQRNPQDFWDQSGSGLMTRYLVQTRFGPVSIVNVHLETPREGFEALLERRLAGADFLAHKNRQRDAEAAELARWSARHAPALVLAGDFNMLEQSRIYRRHLGGFRNAFSAVGRGFGASKHTRWHGLRIDHVLLGPALVAVEARVVPGLGGDHRPLLVRFTQAR